MASSVALVNRDIARHYQLQNLLAPPEAIELTKLYNEMSDILAKPVKFRNKPTQLHLFYDLLSQYSNHLNNLKMDNPNQPIQIPEPQLPTSVLPEQTSPAKQQQVSEDAYETMDDDDSFQDTTVIDNSRHLLSTSTPQSKAIVPFTPPPVAAAIPAAIIKSKQSGTLMTEMSKFLKITRNVETPRKVMQLLAKNDSSFQYNPDDKSVVIRGQSFDGKDFIETLEHLRNPNMKPRTATEKFIIQHVSQLLQSEDPSFQKKLHAKLPGLKNYIIDQPMSTRTGKPIAARQLDLDSTAVTHSNVHEPKKLTKTAGSGRVKKSKHKPLKIHWKRWQNKIRSIFFKINYII